MSHQESYVATEEAFKSRPRIPRETEPQLDITIPTPTVFEESEVSSSTAGSSKNLVESSTVFDWDTTAVSQTAFGVGVVYASTPLPAAPVEAPSLSPRVADHTGTGSPTSSRRAHSSSLPATTAHISETVSPSNHASVETDEVPIRMKESRFWSTSAHSMGLRAKRRMTAGSCCTDDSFNTEARKILKKNNPKLRITSGALAELKNGYENLMLHLFNQAPKNADRELSTLALTEPPMFHAENGDDSEDEEEDPDYDEAEEDARSKDTDDDERSESGEEDGDGDGSGGLALTAT